MAFGPGRLNYNLFHDAARTSIWGNGLSGTGIATASLRSVPVSETGHISAQFPVYGRVPALQAVGMGGYSDTIVVTVTSDADQDRGGVRTAPSRVGRRARRCVVAARTRGRVRRSRRIAITTVNAATPTIISIPAMSTTSPPATR